ncbi:hypothetical protein Sjap_007880 [Stephania japonica]|uniref:Uncharacterized protein n=1 Tax=Stephania japonica TaxID=461633 RepID=A0AAP0JNF4_9MAGN
MLCPQIRKINTTTSPHLPQSQCLPPPPPPPPPPKSPPHTLPIPPPKGIRINCGATEASVIDGRTWLPDTNYVSSGTPKTINASNLVPILATVRSFPRDPAAPRRKFCYVLPVYRGAKYLVRTSYYYGGVNGEGSPPPVFDQIVDGTLWSVVNTTEENARGLSAYYEGVFMAMGKSMSVCVATNVYTDSDPFMSALEVLILGGSLYNSTDFRKYGLGLVARNLFGYDGEIVKYPDDPFDRFWEPYLDKNSITERVRNLSASGFWNLPPSKLFDTGLTTDQAKPMVLQWPPVSLPNSFYYISLYFADNRDSSLVTSRAFSVVVNGIEYYSSLNVTTPGVSVFATRWPLTGSTNITLIPSAGSDVGPVINGGEIFDVLLLGGRTLTRDVIAIEKVKKSLQNTPLDWNGDPCQPNKYSWTGVTCSEGPRIRVVALNLSSMGLSGSLSPAVANLTALTDIWLGNNNLSGVIPDLSSLRMLKTLHLENNQFSGEIPVSLGAISSLQELYIQNNNLTGEVPKSLRERPGLKLQFSPGNHFSFPSSPSAT